FLRLWIAVLVIYPTNQAVIALTFSNYVLQPPFPPSVYVSPSENSIRVLLTWVDCSSVRWATRVQDVFTTGKLLALGLSSLWALCRSAKYNWLEPAHAFETFQSYDNGQIALSFLQGSFAYRGMELPQLCHRGACRHLKEPSLGHLHLHPPGDVRLRVRQHRLRHRHESSGAAGLQRRRRGAKLRPCIAVGNGCC
ncbi:unnamed protein product, partial [Coregonus sp. 'balchen']